MKNTGTFQRSSHKCWLTFHLFALSILGKFQMQKTDWMQQLVKYHILRAMHSYPNIPLINLAILKGTNCPIFHIFLQPEMINLTENWRDIIMMETTENNKICVYHNQYCNLNIQQLFVFLILCSSALTMTLHGICDQKCFCRSF